MILALANQKGGVGKTASAFNLGHALAELAISRLLADIEAGRFDLAAEKEAATWKIRR